MMGNVAMTIDSKVGSRYDRGGSTCRNFACSDEISGGREMSRKTFVSRNMPVVHLKRNIFAKITDSTYLATRSKVGGVFGHS